MERQNKVVIAGGTGFIGKALAAHLIESRYAVTILTRQPKNPHEIQWDAKTIGSWQKELEDATAVVNLAGTPIGKHWSESTKLSILQSRLESTKAIGDAILACANPPRVWVNSSAIGYYGDRGEEILEESSDPGTKGHFLVDTCVAWEHAQWSIVTPNTRQIRMRTGHALGRGGGLFEPLYKLAKWFLGGHVGNGRQYMSWIHIVDLCALYRWAIENQVEGPINGTAAEPVTNQQLMLMLRSILQRPWAPPVPAFVLKLIAMLGGPEASLLLQGQRVIPKRALEEGFEFKFSILQDALLDLVRADLT